VKSELKAVLDSWVRYEQQQREAEQTALVQSVRESVEAELNKPAFRRQLLEEALTQVERESWFHIAFTEWGADGKQTCRETRRFEARGEVPLESGDCGMMAMQGGQGSEVAVDADTLREGVIPHAKQT